MNNHAPRPNILVLWQLLVAFTSLSLGSLTALAQEPADAEPLDFLINAIVGLELDFQLEIPATVSSVTFAALPDGLSFEAASGKIRGIPATAGNLETNINFQENGQAQTKPVRFAVYTQTDFPGDLHNPNPPHNSDGTQDPNTNYEPTYIHGVMGEPLHFQINYNLSSVGFEVATHADGTRFQLPQGIQLDSAQSSFVGTPSVAGSFDFALALLGSQDSIVEHFVFEIQPSRPDGSIGTPDGTPTNPDGSTGQENQPITIQGVVGYQLHYPLYIPAAINVNEFTPLPAGLVFDPLQKTIAGTPESAGTLDSVFRYSEGTELRERAVIFNIFLEAEFAGDPANPNPLQDPNDSGSPGNPTGPGNEIRIFGKAGEPIHHPIGHDSSTASVEFAVRPDGTGYQLPEGIDFKREDSSFAGVPNFPGIYDFVLIISTDTGRIEERYVFDISGNNQPPINIIGDVGFDLEFMLGLGDDITDLVFDRLPEGISFDSPSATVKGKPVNPGFFETRLRGMRGDEAASFTVYFDIFGDFGPGPGDGGQAQEMKIHGWVGEFISFPLPFDPQQTAISLTVHADGTEAFLPKGVQLDTVNGMLVGFPQEPGFFGSSLTLTEGEKSSEIQVFFDIQYLNQGNPGTPGDPGDPGFPGDPNVDNGPQGIDLFGEVGARFAFKLPLRDDEQAKLPSEVDGVAFGLPDGLTYNAEKNSITGAPTESGVFEVLVLVEGPSYMKEKRLRFLVSDEGAAPRLSFYSESEYEPGRPFSFQINASGSPTLYEFIGLPPELQLDASTGLVSGTIDRFDEFDLIVIASNEAGKAYGIHFLDSNEHGPDEPGDPNNPDDPSNPDGADNQKDEEDPEPFFARLGVPFILEAPSEFAEAVFAVVDGETFPAGIGFDSTGNAVLSGTPTEAGLSRTKITITRGDEVMRVTLWFYVADSVEVPQFVASDYIRTKPGESFELRLPVANGPATIEIQSGPDGVSYDSVSKSLRGVLSDPGFYTLLVSATNDAGIGIHVVEIDVWDDGTGYNPGNDQHPPIHAFGIVGERFDFPLPANPQNSIIAIVDAEDGSTSEIPAGLEYIESYAIVRGTPQQEGVNNLYLEITEFGFTRREHIIFEIFTKDNLPDNPDFPTGPGYDEPDDGHVEPILGKVGDRLYFEAPISGEGVTFELVAGPDGEASELPPGVTFDAELGILSGVPTAFGIYPLWVQVDQFGSARTHFAPVIVSGVEGSPVITSDEFFTTIPGERFKFEIKASNEPTKVEVDFFDVPGVLSFNPDAMVLEGKFDFGGFFTLLVSASNDVGTGYGLLNIDVLGLNHDGGPNEGPNEIPMHINGTVNQEIDFPLPSFIRGSKFELAPDPTGIQAALPAGLQLDAKTGRVSGIPEQPGFSFVWVTVDDGDLPSLALNIGIAQGMRTPEIVSPEFWLGHQDSPFRYQIHATDGPFKFYAEGLPTGLTLDEYTGTIRGTTSAAGDFQVSIAAENPAGKGQARTLFLSIEEKPRLPIVSAPFYNEGQVGAEFSLQVNATEEPGFYHAGGLPAGLTIDSETGLISGTPLHFGYFNVKLEATNEWGRGFIQIAIYVKRAALAPVYVGPNNLGGKVGRAFSFNPPVSGNVSTYAVDQNSPNPLPEGLSLDPQTGAITGTPASTLNGLVNILISGEGGSTIASLYIKIVAALDAPAITSSPFAKGTSGQALSFQLAASNSPIEFAAANLPAGLAIDTATGIISGTPESAGFYDIVVSARNASGWGQARLLILDVIPGLQAPVVTSAPWAKGEVGKAFSYQIVANNTPTSYKASGDLPDGLAIDESTGLISGTPTQAGFEEVTLSASNASGQGNGLLFIFAIRASQEMPVVTSSGTAFAKVGEPFVYQIRAKANPTSYAAENLPDGLSLNAGTGFISGTPTAPTTAPIVIVMTASNAAGQSLPRALLLEIQPAAEAPVILSGGHAIGKVGVEFEFQVFATNDPTAYSSPDLPEGLSIASDTGLISGSPEEAGEFKVKLQASNDAGTGDPATILLFIIPGADMPRVTSATHAIGKVGEAFEYRILSSTEEVNSYQVEGDLPRGLDFDPTTGLISGSPVEPIIQSVYLTVTNDAGTSAPQPFTIKIDPSLEAPIITSSLRLSGTVGEELSYTIAASNMPEERPLPPSAEFDAIGLPGGLGINSATGIISGFPQEAGTYLATIVAANETGEGAPRFLNIKIKPAPTAPVVTSVFRVGAQVGKSFDYQIVATNSPTSYDADHSISWLVADTQTGSLTGTPTKPGVYYAALFAVNEAGESNPGPLEITVYPAANTPRVTSERSAEGKVGTAFEYTITGSNDPTSFAVSGLPAGLTLNPTTGVISGTPTASGTFNIVIVGSNSNGEGTQAILVLTISPRTKITIVVPGT